jgi:hypothetical protein
MIHDPRRVPSIPSLRVAALAALAAACDPEPNFPPPILPLVGVIEAEARFSAQPFDDGHRLVTRAEPGGDFVSVLVPKGAAPPGTAMAVRLVSGVQKASLPELSAAHPAIRGRLGSLAHLVVQVAPAGLPLAEPLVLSFSSRPQSTDQTVVVLHAREEDAAWSVLGRTIVPAGAQEVKIPLDRPGLYRPVEEVRR